ncbi:MAG: DUF2263 domain-containing protein [Sandaracinaceae bacterium]|nr:DUF2263 domain-containing protein [Sandaracinaceae bacterium]
MAGRTLRDEAHFAGTHYAGRVFARRREVLRETIERLSGAGRARYAALAQQNLERWSAAARDAGEPGLTATEPGTMGPRVRVVPHDWGVATARLTRETGTCCAVLNMANAFCPGGAYVEGTPAQEENLFRRTDCHFAVAREDLDPRSELYLPHVTALLSARDGRVYLDTGTPRVCVRGPEERGREDLGYGWLSEDEVFPFYELRAAAVDLRDGTHFDEREAQRRIEAQLHTLAEAHVTHAVLSAFGCGAFLNPAERVAVLYREALSSHGGALREVVFAVYAPGYGPDNYTPFARAFGA